MALWIWCWTIWSRSDIWFGNQLHFDESHYIQYHHFNSLQKDVKLVLFQKNFLSLLFYFLLSWGHQQWKFGSSHTFLRTSKVFFLKSGRHCHSYQCTHSFESEFFIICCKLQNSASQPSFLLLDVISEPCIFDPVWYFPEDPFKSVEITEFQLYPNSWLFSLRPLMSTG